MSIWDWLSMLRDLSIIGLFLLALATAVRLDRNTPSGSSDNSPCSFGCHQECDKSLYDL